MVQKDSQHTGALVATGFLAIVVVLGVAYYRNRRQQRGKSKAASAWVWALVVALSCLNAFVLFRFVKKHGTYSDSPSITKKKNSVPATSTNIQIFNSPSKHSDNAGADEARTPDGAAQENAEAKT